MKAKLALVVIEKDGACFCSNFTTKRQWVVSWRLLFLLSALSQVDRTRMSHAILLKYKDVAQSNHI